MTSLFVQFVELFEDKITLIGSSHHHIMIYPSSAGEDCFTYSDDYGYYDDSVWVKDRTNPFLYIRSGREHGFIVLG